MNAKLLVKRINDGGKSGLYLREAVRSSCSAKPFSGSLSDFVFLDDEGQSLFLGVVKYKTTQGWSETVLLDILHETE